MSSVLNRFKIILEDLSEKENMVNSVGIGVSHQLGC